ncbi:MAG: serine/threonine protein kinase, partial [Pseudomonadota bacterium]
PDGAVLYVARGHLGDVAAFDIASGEVIWRRAIPGIRADHMTLSPDGRRLYVSALTANVVVAIDAESGRITGDFATGTWPHDNHMSKDGKRIYNASIGDLRRTDLLGKPLDKHDEEDPRQFLITVADAQTLEVLDEFPFAAGVRPFQLNTDESVAYLQLSNTHSIVSYDLNGRRIANRIDLPVNDGVQVHDWDFQAPHHGLALSPDGELLCAAGRASDYAAVVRAEDLSLLGTIAVGDAPSWSEITEGGDVCVVANTRSDDVSLVSLSGLNEIARLKTGDGPKHISIGRVPELVLARFE